MPLDPSKIRKRREGLGLTQAQAAKLAKMPAPHWSRIESGNRSDPKLSTAEKVARALQTDLTKILVRES